MRLGPRKMLAALATVLAVAALAAVVTFVGQDAALVALGALQVVTLLVVAGAFVELDRRRRQASRGTEAAFRRALSEVSPSPSDRVDEHRRALQAELRDHRSPLPTREDLDASVKAEGRGLRESIARVEERLTRRGVETFAQVEALAGLYVGIRPERALPPTRGWAASPDLLLTCWNLALQRCPELIVECGSGVSTLVLAYACRRNGTGHVVALDHDEAFADATRRLLREHGLEGWAEVRTAPLEPFDDEGQRWYRLGEVPEGPIDLVLVDGPPAGQDPGARTPALDVMHPRLSARAMVVVDDHKRAGERAVVAEWLGRYPDLRLEELKLEKGCALLQRSPAP